MHLPNIPHPQGTMGWRVPDYLAQTPKTFVSRGLESKSRSLRRHRCTGLCLRRSNPDPGMGSL